MSRRKNSESRSRISTSSFSPTTDESQPPPRFFVDVSLGSGRIPAFIRAQGFEARTKVEQYGSRKVPDEEWIAWCGTDWVALTKDEAIRRRQQELMAAKRSRVRMFTFTNQQLSGVVMLEYLERHWSRMVRLAGSEPGPFIYGIYSDRVSELSQVRAR